MTAAQLEKDLKALRGRREEIDAERAGAQEAVEEARSALVDGSASSTDDVKAAQGELTALKETVEGVDVEIERKSEALEEARAREERAEKVDRLEELAEAAAEERQAFDDKREELSELIEEYGVELTEIRSRWYRTHRAFQRQFLQLAPGMNMGRVRGARDRDRAEEMEEEREELAETLRERGADLDAAMPARFVNYVNFQPAERVRGGQKPTRGQRLVHRILKAYRNA